MVSSDRASQTFQRGRIGRTWAFRAVEKAVSIRWPMLLGRSRGSDEYVRLSATPGAAMSIQIDMFDVQLGAAVLLQFETDGVVIRVLADGGNKKHRIIDRLKPTMDAFDAGSMRIDLMVGTHYDADHLEGLVDIIKDESIEIGEVWLPPIANDVTSIPSGKPPADEELLALQLLSPDGESVLRHYLSVKAQICAMPLGDEKSNQEYKPFASSQIDGLSPDWAESYFGNHLVTARQALRGRASTGQFPMVNPGPDSPADGHVRRADQAIESFLDPSDRDFELFKRMEHRFAMLHSVRARGNLVKEYRAVTQALIKEAAATDALNAASLNKVVQALKVRKIKARCCTISDGAPRKFSWDAATGRFNPVGSPKDGVPQLTLLGPSDGLVARYRDRLPRGDYSLTMGYMTRVVGTTASNELSYVIRLDHQKQRILVTGDAGCVDFAPTDSDIFHPALLKELEHLDVVQIAHHGGANAYFYNCLLASNYPKQIPTTYLLLSHEKASSSRPSGAFSKFVEALGRPAPEVQLLFTAQPREAKVRDVLGYFAKTKGVDTDLKGDVRMAYEGSDWVIKRHIIEPPST